MSEPVQAPAAPTAIKTELPIPRAAFDTSDLIARMKRGGLPAVEAVLKVVAGSTIDWLSEGCALKGGKLGWLATPIAGAKPKVMELIDKLDGVKN